MPANAQSISEQRPVIEFKSSSITLPTLTLAGSDVESIAEQLLNKVRQAPEFFKNSPVLLDLHEINRQAAHIDFEALLAAVNAAGLIPVGIRGGSDKQITAALGQRIAAFPESRGNAQSTAKPAAKASPAEPEAAPQEHETKPQEVVRAAENKLITQPIRSGQRVYSSGDLVILAQVSAGAEIMAEGNIHVYNTLRGRAIAGVHGNTASRIFCFDLQAELISIAGHYRVSEDLDESVRGKPVQIYLDNQSLLINDL